MTQERLRLFAKRDASICLDKNLSIVDSTGFDDFVCSAASLAFRKITLSLWVGRTDFLACMNSVFPGWVLPKANDVPLTTGCYCSHLTTASHTRPFPHVWCRGCKDTFRGFQRQWRGYGLFSLRTQRHLDHLHEFGQG